MSENKSELEGENNIPTKNAPQSSDIQKTAGRSMKKAISLYFPSTPAPLKKPHIDKDFNDLPVIDRVTESISYNILCLEYSISPKGGLRQWIKINISLLLLFGIPILIFVPLATYFMAGFSDISELFSNATHFLLESAFNILKLIGVIIAIASILYIIFKFMALRFGQKGKKSNDEDDYINVTPSKKL